TLMTTGFERLWRNASVPRMIGGVLAGVVLIGLAWWLDKSAKRPWHANLSKESTHGEPPLRVVASGSRWHRRSLERLFHWVWRLARSEVPERMSQREFRGFLADLERLR